MGDTDDLEPHGRPARGESPDSGHLAAAKLACVVCVLIFVGMAVQPGSRGAGSRFEGLFPSSFEIWGGAFWGLLTSVFVHADAIHLLFNVLWLWQLGTAVELSIGSVRWILFFLAAAWVSSGIQLLTGNAGVGMSGVVYALFGFAWLSRDRYPELEEIVTLEVVRLFLVWGVGCYVVTALGWANIGNEAHLGGLLFGAGLSALGAPRYSRPLVAAGLLLLVVASIVPLFWCPWSRDWTASKAVGAHAAGRHDEAVRWYLTSLRQGADAAWAWSNLAEIYGYQEKRAEYRDALIRLRTLDPEAARETEGRHGPVQTP